MICPRCKSGGYHRFKKTWYIGMSCPICGYWEELNPVVKSIEQVIQEEKEFLLKERKKPVFKVESSPCPACGSKKFDPFKSKSGVCGDCSTNINHWLHGRRARLEVPIELLKGKMRAEVELKLAGQAA